jgi:hypothetical protein
MFIKENDEQEKKEKIVPKVIKPKGTYPDQFQVLLQQEVQRYNFTLALIKETCNELLASLDGQALFSNKLETLYNHFSLNQVPTRWTEEIEKTPLLTWFEEFQEKVSFFTKWLNEE